MNNKSCFLIISYTPTLDREFVLVSLLRKIKNAGHSIVLATHNMPSSLACQYADYIVYDSNNEIINYYPKKDEEFHPKIFYNIHIPDFRLRSPFTSRIKYHGIAAASLLFQGLMSAKMFGFEKCHLLEYDSDFNSLEEFEENNILLDKYDSIHYFYGPHDCMIHGSIGSFNLNSYSYGELAWNENKERIKEIINSEDNDLNGGMVEVGVCELLHKSKNTFRKTQDNFINGGIVTDLSHKVVFDNKDYIEAIPFLIHDTVSMLLFFQKKSTNVEQKIQVIVNDAQIHTKVLHHENEWIYFNLCLIDELKTISVIWNNNVLKVFDFVNDIDKEIFSKLSRARNSE